MSSVTSIFRPLPHGADILQPLSPRMVDRCGSFSSPKDIHAFIQTCKRGHWIFQARIKMLRYLKEPLLREKDLGESIGMTIVYKKSDHQPRLVKIKTYCTSDKFVGASADVYDADRSRYQGFIEIYLNDGLFFGSPYSERISGKIDKIRLREMYVDGLNRRTNYYKPYSGTGTALMQAFGLEWGQLEGNNCDLRLRLSAVDTSHGFYWGLRMRFTKGPELDQKLASKLIQLHKQGKKELEETFGEHYMYLPIEAANEWRCKILQNPILDETRALIKQNPSLLQDARDLASTYPIIDKLFTYVIILGQYGEFWEELPKDVRPYIRYIPEVQQASYACTKTVLAYLYPFFT